MEDPVTERGDEAALLRDVDESARREQLSGGSAHANQGFDAQDPPRIGLHLWLIVEHEAVATQGLAESPFDRHAFEGDLVHRGAEELVIVPPLLLGVVHGQVGIPEQRVLVRAVRGEHGDADAAGDVHVAFRQRDRLPHYAEKPAGDAAGVLHLLQPGEHDGELVAPEAGNGCLGLDLGGRPGQMVAHPHRCDQPLRDLLENLIARRVALGVIDALEAIQVEEQEARLLAVLGGKGQDALEAIFEHHCGWAGPVRLS